MRPRPVQVKSLLIEQLREAIASGRLPPGQRLTELKLANGLGVSRTPVREALMALNQLGLITRHESGRGFEVRGYSLKEAKDILYVRAILEGGAAELLAGKPSPDVIERLREILAWERDQLEQGVYPTLRRGGHRFHETIVQSTGSRELQTQFRNVLDKMRTISTSDAVAFENRWRSHEDHCGIVNAIASGDGNLARQRVMDHCNMALETLMRDPARLGERRRPLQLILDDVREQLDQSQSR